jgi:cardiolipin synthase C
MSFSLGRFAAFREGIARTIRRGYMADTSPLADYRHATRRAGRDIRRLPAPGMLRQPLKPRAAIMNAPIKMLHRSLAAPLLAVLVALATAGCVGLPMPVEGPPAYALSAPQDVPLAKLVAASTPPGMSQLSGLKLLPDGRDALATRLALIRHSRVSLDLQTYLLAGDATGRQLLHEMQLAADRGVRVRLLIDDLHAVAQDALLAALDRHPCIEVRLFNPLPVRVASPVARILLSMHEFARINRRMHNKLFIADGRLALVGGRNVGDDYFMRSSVANFIDVDILATGAVVPKLAGVFDDFWNDRLAHPIAGLVTASADAAVIAPDPLPAPHGAASGSVAAHLESGRLDLRFAAVKVFADPPAKASHSDATAKPGEAMAQALELMRAAASDVTIATPYFVPGPLGMALIEEARQRGVQLSVITNSLAATDEPLAHQGYKRYRLGLLKLGVKLAELSPSARTNTSGALRSSLGRLHAKLAVVDRRWLLVGSLNMDLRSSRLNTEIALAIDDAHLATEAAALLQQHWEQGNYELRLAQAGERIEWVANHDSQLKVHRAEPHADWLSRFRLGLISTLVPEELL